MRRTISACRHAGLRLVLTIVASITVLYLFLITHFPHTSDSYSCPPTASPLLGGRKLQQMMRICRLAELDCQRDQQQQHKLRRRIRSISNGTTSPQRHRPNPSSFLPPPAGVPASRGASHGGGVGEVTIVSSSRASPARSRSERTTRLLTNGDNAGSAIRGASSTMTVSAVSSATAYKNNGESDGDPTVSIPRTRGFFSGQSTRAVGDGGSMESSAHHVAWQERVDGGGGSGSASTSISYDSASGRSFLGRLNNVAPPAAVSRRRHGDGAGREGVYLGLSPLLGRAASEPSAVSPAALTVAVARGRAEGRGTAESAAKMLWSRALQKLKLKKRCWRFLSCLLRATFCVVGSTLGHAFARHLWRFVCCSQGSRG